MYGRRKTDLPILDAVYTEVDGNVRRVYPYPQRPDPKRNPEYSYEARVAKRAAQERVKTITLRRKNEMLDISIRGAFGLIGLAFLFFMALS